jgi:2-oxoglutarate dehydrogenase E2 component (dihydrolipoamide succinyltransferase)
MPQLGETVTEGTILRWAKQVGDTIAEDEVLVEISTDKVDTEVPSPVGGTILEILVEEGDTVEVGVDLVVIGAADEAPAGTQGGEPAAEEPAEAETPDEPAEETEEMSAEIAQDLHPASETPSGADTGFESGQRQPAPDGKVSDEEIESFFTEPSAAEKEPRLLSPVVRKLIREHDVDISQIEGSGQGGRITRKDVEKHIEAAPVDSEREPEPAPAAEPEPQPEPVAEEPVTPTAPEPVSAAKSEPAMEETPERDGEPAAKPSPAPAAATGSETVELSRMRVRVAENNLKAKQTAAHVWTSIEVDFERVERVRQAHKEQFKAEEGFSLTYLPFISRATIDALKAFPVVNSSFDLEGKTATFFKKIDLGIAIDLNQEGLVVARVRNADGLRMVGIAREISSLAERGRSGDLGIDDLTGSTFTITNPGPFGSFMSAPIINVPNVAILSTDTVAKRPTVVTAADGQDVIAIRHIGYLGLSWDHRAFDGSTAVLFLRRIKENIETWDWEQELA